MKDFIKHFFTLFLGTGLNVIIGIITVPIITRLVDPNEYGQLSFFNMYCNIAYMILLLGLDQAYVRFFYQKKTEEYKKSLFYACLKLPIILSIPVSILILCFGKNFIQVNHASIVLVIFVFNVISQILQRFVLLTLRLELNTKLYSFLNVLNKIIYTTMAIILIKIFNKDYFILLIIATFLGVLIPTLVGILYKKNLYFNNKLKKENIDTRKLVKYGYPFIFSSVLSMGFQYSDKIMIKQFGTYSDVGIYASAMNIVSMFSIIYNVFNTLWVPLAMEKYAKDSQDKKFYQMGNQIITVIMFFMAINVILFKDIIILFLDERYIAATFIIPALIFEPVMNTISETTVNGINFAKKSKMHIVITGTCCLANLVGNAILVPYLGGKGAAISTGLSYILFFMLRTKIANRYYYIDFKIKRILILIGAVMLYALYNTFNTFNLLNLIMYIIVLVLLIILYKNIILKGWTLTKEKINQFKERKKI